MDKFSKEVEMPTCTLKTIRRFVEKTNHLPEDRKITLEIVLLMTFPEVYKTINKAMSDNYTLGYLQGLKDAKNEN